MPRLAEHGLGKAWSLSICGCSKVCQQSTLEHIVNSAITG